MRRSTLAALAGAAAFAAACAAGSVRPSFEPFPEARVDTINAAPPAVIEELASQVFAEKMRPQWNSPAEGYLETQWFNIVTQESGTTDRGNPDRVILLRFWADSLPGGKTKLTSEAVYMRTTDPSVLGRDREMMVPPGHGGDRLRSRVIEAAKEKFGT